MGLTLTNGDTSIWTFKRWHSPAGFVSVSELRAASDQFSGSSPEQWRQRLLWGMRRRSFKTAHFKMTHLQPGTSGVLTIPLVLGEPVGVFFLGLLLLQQRQKPLLLLTRAVHEVIPWLREQERNKVHLWRNDCFIGCIMSRWGSDHTCKTRSSMSRIERREKKRYTWDTWSWKEASWGQSTSMKFPLVQASVKMDGMAGLLHTSRSSLEHSSLSRRFARNRAEFQRRKIMWWQK